MAIARVNGQEFYYEDVGSGLPVVLGHSFLCSGDMWRDQVRALSSSYRIINIDFRGHGKSSPALESFSLYDAVGDVIGVLDSLQIERAVWCGLSVGGMVALRAAITEPDRVLALVILDSDAGAEHQLRVLKYRLMGIGARTIGIRPFLSPVARMMFGETTRRDRPSLVAEWREIFASVDVKSTLFGLAAVTGRDSILSRLPEISVPALVAVGLEDQSLEPRRSKRIRDGLADAEYAEISGAGHLSALEQPEAVNDVIERFLQRVSRRESVTGA